MKKYLWILLAVCVICIGALAVSSFADATTAVYVDQANGSDDAAGTKEEPVNSMEKAFELLPEGGTLYVIGRYTISEFDSKQVVSFPETNGEVLITSADRDNMSSISFECEKKTYVQFKSPVAFDYIHWAYNHGNVGGKGAGAMDIYSGPSLTFGEFFNFSCINDSCPSKPKHENCVAIRGGWFAENYKGTYYTGSDIELTVLGGNWAYINGGSGNGTVAVGNSEITFGGNAEIYQRLQIAGSNGGDVTGNAVVNIIGGKIGTGGSETNADTVADYGLFLIGHAKNTNTAEIAGNVTINIVDGYINVIKAARTAYESIKGDLTLNVSSNATINKVSIDTARLNLEKTQTLNVETADADIMDTSLFVDKNGSAEFWDAANLKEVKVTCAIDAFNGDMSKKDVADMTIIQGQEAKATILGWVITDAGLSDVKYTICEAAPVSLEPTRERDDVVKHVKYTGELVAANKVGIGLDAEHAAIELSYLEVGEHEINLYAYTNFGTEVLFKTFYVTVAEPLADGEIIDLGAIKEPGEYKLVADVTGGISLSSGTYVIDLNGHTWTNSGVALDVAGADVTIIDSEGSGYIMATANDCVNVGAGKFTLTEATAIATADGMDAIFVGGGTVVVNSGVLYGGKSGINAANTGVDITVNGGTFNGVFSGEPFDRTAAIEFRNNAKVKLIGDVYFNVDRIIKRANHTITWEETFIIEDDMQIAFEEADIIMGNFGGNDYFSNVITYTQNLPTEGESADYPYFIYDEEDTITVEAGQTFYVAGFWGGMELVITGDGEFSIVYNNETITSVQGGIAINPEAVFGRPMPVIIAITNNSDATVEYTFVAAHPEGSSENPEEYDPIKGGSYVAELEAGNAEGYYYTFTATEAGSITLYIDSITNGATADIMISVIDPDFMVIIKSLSEDGVDGKVTVDYAAGDNVVINVVAEPDADWNYPATTVTITQYVESSDTGDFGLIALAFVALSSVVVKKRKEI